jgi:hypothetical protein
LLAIAVDGDRQLVKASRKARNAAHTGWQTNRPTPERTTTVAGYQPTCAHDSNSKKLDFRAAHGATIIFEIRRMQILMNDEKKK